MILNANSRAFFKTLREAMFAYSFDVGGLLAGLIFLYGVASRLEIFNVPWIIAVYPTVLSAKGMIGGLLCGRLSTALHVGTVYPRFFGNTRSFYRLIEAVVVITIETSIVMSLISLVFGSLFWGITPNHFPDILLVVVTTMAFGLTIFALTIAVSFFTFKKGLDPDVAVYPIMSTTADIIITIFYVLSLSLFFLCGFFGKIVVTLVVVLAIILLLYVSLRDMREEDFVRTVKESFLTLILVSFIVNITGTVLHRMSKVIEKRSEIYTVYPSLIDMVGDVGSVVGSTATTKLALGLLKPSFSAIRNHAAQIFSTWMASIVWFILLSVLSLSINGMLANFPSFTLLLLISNVIAVSAVVLVSYAVSILTFQKGLDPDNFVIPIESSLADSLTSIGLLVALVLVALVSGG